MLVNTFRQAWQYFKTSCQSVQIFQDRIWIVSIQKNANDGDQLLQNTFIVSEDSFSSSMSWMHDRGYSELMITKVDDMKRSNVVKVQVNEYSHSLIRVK